MFFEDLARLSEKGGQMRQAEIYRECSEMAKQARKSAFELIKINKERYKKTGKKSGL